MTAPLIEFETATYTLLLPPHPLGHRAKYVQEPLAVCRYFSPSRSRYPMLCSRVRPCTEYSEELLCAPDSTHKPERIGHPGIVALSLHYFSSGSCSFMTTSCVVSDLDFSGE